MRGFVGVSLNFQNIFSNAIVLVLNKIQFLSDLLGIIFLQNDLPTTVVQP